VQGHPQHLRRVAFAQAKGYVRKSQVRLLVQPLLERLRAALGAAARVEQHLLGLLSRFRAEDTATQGYDPANVISLLTALRGLDLSRLTTRLWEIPSSGRAACVQILAGHSSWVRGLAFAPNGRRLASASFDGMVKMQSLRVCTSLGLGVIRPERLQFP
jgi:hypothetical protein